MLARTADYSLTAIEIFRRGKEARRRRPSPGVRGTERSPARPSPSQRSADAAFGGHPRAGGAWRSLDPRDPSGGRSRSRIMRVALAILLGTGVLILMLHELEASFIYLDRKSTRL